MIMRSGRKENGDTEIDIVDVGTDNFIICMFVEWLNYTCKTSKQSTQLMTDAGLMLHIGTINLH